MSFKRQKRTEPGIDLTPLIDVVFLLVIFFMVATTFKKENHITLSLPQAENKNRQMQNDVIYVSVSSIGEYSVNSRTLVKSDARTLASAIEGLNIHNKQTPVVIAADAQASHQSVVTVMDVAAKLGLSRVSIATTETVAK